MGKKVYLEMDYPPTAETQWINRIQSRLHQSSSETLTKRVGVWKESGLGEFALIIATRTAVLRHILLHLAKEMGELEQELGRRKGDVREAIEMRLRHFRFKGRARLLPDGVILFLTREPLLR